MLRKKHYAWPQASMGTIYMTTKERLPIKIDFFFRQDPRAQVLFVYDNPYTGEPVRHIVHISANPQFTDTRNEAKVFTFYCPKCAKRVKDLYMMETGRFSCMYCERLRSMNIGQTRAAQAKRALSRRSIYKRLSSLEVILARRAQLKRLI